MHLFLTGAVGCGKSTVIRKTAALAGMELGGFCTGFGPDRGARRHALYLWPAGEAPVFDEAHMVARFDPTGVTVLTGRFNELGCAALDCPAARLILMDECGRLEEGALQFRAATLTLLEGGRPVLGVVRQGFPGWTKAIAAHPGVDIIEVDKSNRDTLPQMLLHRLKRTVPPSP